MLSLSCFFMFKEFVEGYLNMHNYGFGLTIFQHVLLVLITILYKLLAHHWVLLLFPIPSIIPWTRRGQEEPCVSKVDWMGNRSRASVFIKPQLRHLAPTPIWKPGQIGDSSSSTHAPFFFSCLHTDTHSLTHTHTLHSTLACLVLLLVSGEEVEVGVLSNVQLTHIYARRYTHTQPFPPLLTPWLTRPVNCTDRTLRLVRVPLI